MPKEGCQERQSALDINAFSIPPEQAVDGERVTQIVQPRWILAGNPGNAQRAENVAEEHHQCPWVDGFPPFGREHGVVLLHRQKHCAPNLQVTLQALPQSRSEWDETALVELRLVDEQNLTFQVNMLETQPENFAQAESQGAKQCQHGGIRVRSAATIRPPPGRFEHCCQLFLGKNERLERGSGQSATREEHGVFRHDGPRTQVLEKAVNHLGLAHSRVGAAREFSQPFFDRRPLDGFR